MLKLLNQNEYEKARSIFSEFIVNEPLIYSVLDFKSAGKVYTDNKQNPSFALLYTEGSTYTFLAGDLDSTSLANVTSLLKTYPLISLVSPPKWKYQSFFEEMGFKEEKLIQFRSFLDPAHWTFWMNSLPLNCSANKIDDTNFSKCDWYEFITTFYGNKNAFFSNGAGFCLETEGKVISESYALIGSGKAELGIATNKDFQRQNYGTIAMSFILDYCSQQNIEPYWTCKASNIGSSSMAKKLGFKESCRYSLLTFSA